MSAFVIDVTTETFQQDVIDASFKQPVLVDFWADWCAPCKQLAPVLEALADEYAGGFVLAKVDTEAHQMLASQAGIRSLPTVLLVKEGQVADHFMGALPEGEVRAFLDKHVEAAPISPLEAARAYADEGDFDEAVAVLQAVVEQDPENHEAFLELAQVLSKRGDQADAVAIVERLPADWAIHPSALSIQAAGKLHTLVEDAPALVECQSRVDANPDDLEARYFLAAREAQSGQIEAAVERLLGMVRDHRDYNDDAARKMLVQLFDLLGKEHPAVRAGRRKLATLLN